MADRPVDWTAGLSKCLRAGSDCGSVQVWDVKIRSVGGAKPNALSSSVLAVGRRCRVLFSKMLSAFLGAQMPSVLGGLVYFWAGDCLGAPKVPGGPEGKIVAP